MTSGTVIKNTFIDVQDHGAVSPSKRTVRRTQTEPTGTNAFAACMSHEASDDDDEDDGPQPAVAFTKTFDPFESAPGHRGSAEGDARADVKSSTRRFPSKKVGFLSACAAEESEEAEVDGGNGRLCEMESEEHGFVRLKSFDNFEAASSLAAPPAMTMPPRGTLPPPTGAESLSGFPATVQPPQVYTIFVPAGMHPGARHIVQLPMGLPPGATIVVAAQLLVGCGVGGSLSPRPVGLGGLSPAGAPWASSPVVAQVAPSCVGMRPPAAGFVGGGGGSQPAPMGVVVGGLQPAPMGVAGGGFSGSGYSALSGMPAGATMDAGGLMLPQTIFKSRGAGGALRVQYVVDARKLKANDKAVISPPFEISPANPGHYRIIVNPSFVKARGGATFKNSGGIGNVQLKCEDQSEGLITFTVWLSDGLPNSMRQELARGPVEHSFVDSSVCGLSKHQEEWDFNQVVDVHSKTFSVFLDIVQ